MLLMIDEPHQRKGYGRAALALAIEHVRRRHPSLKHFYTSCVPGPGSPRPFYETMGFVFTGDIDEDEEVMRLDLQAGQR